MKIIIFCDGACLGNPGRGGWGSIVSVIGGKTRELGGDEQQTTNNRMEMMAVLSAIKFVRAEGLPTEEIWVHTDSKYFIDGISKWIFGWMKNGWKNGGGEDVKNQDLWKEIWELKSTSFSKTQIKWVHVEGHSGVPGNERCDEIATTMAAGSLIEFYDGPTSEYAIDLSVVSSARPKSAKAYYLSVVDGEVYRDNDWPTCQKRVQGRRGVKYKKVYSEADESIALKLWGYKK